LMNPRAGKTSGIRYQPGRHGRLPLINAPRRVVPLCSPLLIPARLASHTGRGNSEVSHNLIFPLPSHSPTRQKDSLLTHGYKRRKEETGGLFVGVKLALALVPGKMGSRTSYNNNNTTNSSLITARHIEDSILQQSHLVTAKKSIPAAPAVGGLVGVQLAQRRLRLWTKGRKPRCEWPEPMKLPSLG
jgi:hypothetical protein